MARIWDFLFGFFKIPSCQDDIGMFLLSEVFCRGKGCFGIAAKYKYQLVSNYKDVMIQKTV